MMYNNFFIDGEEIKQIDQMGKQSVVGYTLASYNQLLSIAEQYKKKLEDAGLIEKKLTQEELMQKQTETLEKLVKKLDAQEEKLKKLEDSLGGLDD